MKSIEELRAAHAAAPGSNWLTYEYTDNKAAMMHGCVQLRADIPIEGGGVYREGIIAVNSSYGQHAGAVYLSADDKRAVLRFAATAHNEFPAMLDEIERLNTLVAEHQRMHREAVEREDTLRDELSSLTEAARAVRDNWESGDLAGAVTRLSSLLED